MPSFCTTRGHSFNVNFRGSSFFPVRGAAPGRHAISRLDCVAYVHRSFSESNLKARYILLYMASVPSNVAAVSSNSGRIRGRGHGLQFAWDVMLP